MLTTRDYKVIDFLTDYKIATTSTIEKLFFTNKRTCQNRLKVLVDAKKIRRIRQDINSDYIYFVKMPKQRRHALYVTEFYREFSKLHKIEDFRCELPLTGIRPDAMIVYRVSSGYQIAFLEVELSHKGFDFNKYEKYSLNENYKEIGIPYMPSIIIVGNQPKIPGNMKCNYCYFYLKEVHA